MASDAEKMAARARVTHINVMAESNDDVCWICLDGPGLDGSRPLQHACKCPSWTHSTCIARWQLQSAGTRREKYCDFCNSELPDWKSVLTPSPGATAPAVMNVNFDNKTYSFQVAPGADGYRQFTEAIRKAFHLPEDSELNITFTCDEPSSGSLLTLSGPGAYDAAVHCASVSAARRSLSSDERPLSAARQQHSAVFDSLPARPAVAGGGAAAAGAGMGSSNCPQQLLVDDGDDILPVRDTDSDGGSSGGSSSHMGRRRSSSSGSSSSSSHRQSQQRSARSSLSNSSSLSSELAEPALSLPVRRASTSSASGGGGGGVIDSAGTTTAGRLRPSSSGSVTNSSLTSHASSSTGSHLSDLASDQELAAGGVAGSSRSGSHSSAASSTSSASSSGGSSSSRARSGLGRKLRDALSDLLISK